MLIRVGDLPVGTRVEVRTGGGPYGSDFYYGTVMGALDSRVCVKWDVGEPIPVGANADYSIDYGPVGSREYEFVTWEEFDGLNPVMPFRGI
jgi:hypothetical protein